MPTRRSKRNRNQRVQVSAEAVAAWCEGDWLELHRALQLKPWEESPLDAEGEKPEYPTTGWEQAVELRAELMRLAGGPGDDA